MTTPVLGSPGGPHTRPAVLLAACLSFHGRNLIAFVRFSTALHMQRTEIIAGAQCVLFKDVHA